MCAGLGVASLEVSEEMCEQLRVHTCTAAGRECWRECWALSARRLAREIGEALERRLFGRGHRRVGGARVARLVARILRGANSYLEREEREKVEREGV